MTRALIAYLTDGSYSFTDFLDDDGVNPDTIPITVNVTIESETAKVDFTGSAPQQQGSVNAVYAITLSAVYYVFRCLLGLDVPNNAGCLAPIKVIAPAGTVVNALHPSPVAGGNVETSQRIVDVLLGALAQACPDKIPAASQGTMRDHRRRGPVYELSAGAWGAPRLRAPARSTHTCCFSSTNGRRPQ
jgi:N-methylhydantoinase B